MDLDATGADISGESQINLSPSSGLDPTRMVRYVPTAATAIYPNVVEPITTPLSVTAQPEVPTAKPLQIVPVVGQNTQKTLDMVQNTPIAPQPRATDFSAQSRRVQPAPQQYDYENAPKPPGTSQGMFGTDRPNLPQYDPNMDPAEVQKQILRSQADQQLYKANDPFRQLFVRGAAEKNAAEAAEKFGEIKKIEQRQQQERDVRDAAANYGSRVGPNATAETVVNDLIRRYTAGGDDAVQARDALIGLGRKDQVEAFYPAFIAGMKDRKDFGDDITKKLDAAVSDEDYRRKREEIVRDATHAPSGSVFNIPKSKGEWDAKGPKRKEDARRAGVMLDQEEQRRANETNFVPETNKELATTYAGKATFYDGTPMPGVKGVTRQADLANGGQLPNGSHDLRGYGKDWGAFTADARKNYDEAIERVLPKGERAKYNGLARIYEGATHDAKGNALPRNEINTNPNMLQGLQEVLTAELRESANAGANASMMGLELKNRGWVQNKIDDLIKNFAGVKGVLTGHEGKYLTKLTQGEKRDVLEFLMAHTTRDVASRIAGPVREAGMKGARPEELGLEKTLLNSPEVQTAHAYGRDRQVQTMSNWYSIIGDNNRYVVGDNDAAKNIVGAKRTPIPASQLPGLSPELFNPPPAATNAPGGSGGPAAPGVPSSVPATPGRGGGSEDFWKDRPGGSGTTGPRSMLDFLNPVSTAHAEAAPPSPNLEQADKDLKLSPQERNLYEFHLHNLTGTGGVDNPDGSRSSLYQVGVEHNGKQYNIPTVFDGKILPVNEAVDRVKKIGWDKFPSYASPQEAEKRYQAMHAYMDKDTGDYLSRRRQSTSYSGNVGALTPEALQAAGQARLAPIPPTVPTPQAPGGPGTSGTPAAAQAPRGSRGGGTFSQGVPSSGFPAHVNGNQVARTVYGTAGQTAQNVTNNPVIANNSAIVATSSAQSESAFNPNESHDNKTGYGLYGHRGDRLTEMRKFAGTKPGEPIPPNVQTSFYVREMSRAADTDPFIAQVMRNPNATAEDLTRVQMRMERPEGFKLGREEEAPSWNKRLANTRALMAGDQSAAVAALVAVAPVAQPATGGLLNPRVARETIRQKAQEVGGDRAMATFIPPAAATGGLLVGGPVGAVVGGAAGQTMVEGLTKSPGERNLTGAAVRGAVEALPMAIPGVGPLAMGARVATGAAGQGGLKWWEGGDADEITAATLMGGAGAVVGEAFGQSLGMVGHRLWSSYSKAAQAELLDVGRTLATQEPKIKDATGKLVENLVYTKAAERAKQMGQDVDHLAYAWNNTARPHAQGGPAVPPNVGEAVTQRPGGVAQLREGRTLEEIKQEVGQAPKPTVTNAPQFTHDPTKIVGTGDVPNTQVFRDAAQVAKDRMTGPAKGWDDVWKNVTQARTDLLTKWREAAGMQEGPGKQEAMKAYRALADHIRGQQEEIVRKLIPDKAKADALLNHLNVTSNAYRKAVLAGGDDIVQVIAQGGRKGREAQAAFDELGSKDPAAEQMLDALVTLHKTANKVKAGAASAGFAGSFLTGAAHLPLLGTPATAILGVYGATKSWQLLRAWMVSRGSGNPVKFNDLVRRARGAKMPVRGAQLGAGLGAVAAPAVIPSAIEAIAP